MPPRPLAVAAAVLITCTLAACGSAAATGAPAPATGTPSPATGSSHPGRYAHGGFRPAVAGVITSVTGRSLRVSSATGSPSKVTWTPTTRIADQQPATRSLLVEGACVSIRPAGPGFRRPAGPGSPRASGSHPARAFTGPVTAGAVTALPTGSCSPSGTTGGLGLTGTVTVVSSGSFTARTVAHPRTPRGTAPTSTPRPTRAALPRTLTVHTTASTTYLRQRTGTDADVQAGLCVTADGTTTGSTLTARALTISQSVNGSCATGFGDTGGGPGGTPSGGGRGA